MIMEPDREVGPGFAATEYFTNPLPVPDEPPVMVMKLSRLTADHEQDPGAVTLTDARETPGPNDAVVGLMDVIQEDPAWVTLNVEPAIVIVPVLIDPVLFAETE